MKLSPAAVHFKVILPVVNIAEIYIVPSCLLLNRRQLQPSPHHHELWGYQNHNYEENAKRLRFSATQARVAC